jgi:hypothetical protein
MEKHAPERMPIQKNVERFELPSKFWKNSALPRQLDVIQRVDETYGSDGS